MKKIVDSRPWGNFVEYTHNEPSTVKVLTIFPHEELSLQYHTHRKEFWRVMHGNPDLIIGDNKIDAKIGDEFEIPENVKHKISAKDDVVHILEISFGDFDEKDIVRLEDKYGRK